MSVAADPRGGARRRPPNKPQPGSLFLLLRDVAVAGAAVFLVIALVWGYSGTWPPMVVIESASMQHADDRSSIGIIDTGDLTLVKKVSGEADIVTYMQGSKTGYQTYGNFGDVIIYSKNGHDEIVPIIHRAITRVYFNATETNRSGVLSLDLPEIPRPDHWGIHADHAFDIGAVRGWHQTGPEGVVSNLTINLQSVAASFGGNFSEFTVGFITKGDHNGGIDQGQLTVFSNRVQPTVQPVRGEWIVGKAQGELPWFGAIKLWAGHSPCPPSCTPGNTWTNLAIAIAVIAVGPYILEKGWERYGNRVTDRIPAGWKARWYGAWDGLPGGEGRAERREERRLELEGERRKRGGRRHQGRGR